MKWAIRVSWLMENGYWDKVAILRGWLDGGKGIQPEDDCMFTVDELVDLEIFIKTGLRRPRPRNFY
jgi:hypothetical protein